MTNALTLSQLEIEPHLVQLSDEDSKSYYPSKDYWLWKIKLNNRVLTNLALPFGATKDVLELYRPSLCFPLLSGNDYIFVRQAGKYIIWYRANDLEAFYPNTRDALRGEIPVFEKLQYDRIISSQQINDFKISRSNSVDSLPELQPDEIKKVFLDRYPELDPALSFPETDAPLYRIPDNPNDSRGYQLMYRLRKAILEAEIPAIVVSDPPETWVELRIGLDLPGVPEAVWWVGKTADKIVIRFVEYPSFPLWLSGQAIDDAFKNDSLYRLSGA